MVTVFRDVGGFLFAFVVAAFPTYYVFSLPFEAAVGDGTTADGVAVAITHMNRRETIRIPRD